MAHTPYNLFLSILSCIAIFTNVEIHAQETLRAEKVRGLQLGDTVAGFTATDNRGKQFSLEETLDSSRVLIVFYRGQWCPVCTRHLSDLQDSLHLIAEEGVELIAISPEKPEKLRMTEGKTGVEFKLLFDEDFRIAEAFELVFMPWHDDLNLYNKVLKADLKNAHSDGSERLPVPATYLINRDGVVVWRHFDPDYTQRASAKDILEQLRMSR